MVASRKPKFKLQNISLETCLLNCYAHVVESTGPFTVQVVIYYI